MGLREKSPGCSRAPLLCSPGLAGRVLAACRVGPARGPAGAAGALCMGTSARGTRLCWLERFRSDSKIWRPKRGFQKGISEQGRGPGPRAEKRRYLKARKMR